MDSSLRPKGNTMKDTELAYVAGFFDGEGSISITPIAIVTPRQKCTFSLRAQAVSTNKEAVNTLLSLFGGVITRKPVCGNRQECWTWRVSNIKAMKFLKLVLPYLRIKRPQAEKAIEFQKHKTRGGKKTEEYINFEAEMKRAFSVMNRRGNGDAMITHGLISAT